jgi:hypothetical protein
MRVFVLTIILGLGLSGALLERACVATAQLAAEDQPQSPTRQAGTASGEAAPAPTDYVIDDEGMPLVLPGNAS